MTVPRHLDEFFALMRPFLEGELSAEELERRLGKSGSGTSRLALYPVLVRRQKQSVLSQFYRAVAAACHAHEVGLWDRLLATFLAANVPDHWEPNRFAEPFVAHVAREMELPAYLRELADFAWIRYSAMIAAHAENGRAGMDSSLFIRQYAHEIPDYTRGAEDGTLPAGTSPQPVPCTVTVCRSRRTGRVEITRPSLAALVALGRRDGHRGASGLPAGLTEESIAREDLALVELGVLAARNEST